MAHDWGYKSTNGNYSLMKLIKLAVQFFSPGLLRDSLETVTSSGKIDFLTHSIIKWIVRFL